jgi:hypothetical protein
VAGCSECGDAPPGFGATKFVTFNRAFTSGRIAIKYIVINVYVSPTADFICFQWTCINCSIVYILLSTNV